MARATTRRSTSVKSPGKQGVGHGVVRKKFKEEKKENLAANPKKLRGALTEVTNLNIVNQLSKKNHNVEKEPKTEDIKMEEDDAEMDGLCEYEKIRLKNIRERQAMFAELEINSAKSEYTVVSTPAPKSRNVSDRGIVGDLKANRAKKEVLPPRKSSRIAGGKVPEITRYVPLEEDTPEEPPVVLEPIKVGESLKNRDEMKEALVTSFLQKLKDSSKNDVKPSRSSNLNNLNLAEEGVAKVVPERIFSMAVHPSPTTLTVAVGDKWGAIGLWDIENTSGPANGVHLMKPHTRPVNCLSWDLANTDNLISTSYDGTVRLLDTEKQEFSMIYGEEEFLSWGGWTSFHTQVDRDILLVSQGKAGSVACMDRRVSWSKPVAKYHLFMKNHAKTIQVHPTRSELLITGNNKAEVCIFDLRTATEGKLMARYSNLMGHTKSISSCAFNPEGDQVVTIAVDDRIRLYDTTTFKPDCAPVCSVKHNNQTGRWLTPFRVCWDPSQRHTFYTGSMDQPRTIEAWSSQGGNLVIKKKMRHELLASVCSIVTVHPSRDVLIGGNSSGRAFCFM